MTTAAVSFVTPFAGPLEVVHRGAALLVVCALTDVPADHVDAFVEQTAGSWRRDGLPRPCRFKVTGTLPRRHWMYRS